MLTVSKINSVPISFKKLILPPKNYKVIDEYVSRSAQPDKESFLWLKNQGITDVINFRTMYEPKIDFDESQYLKQINLNYHHLPTGTRTISELTVKKFIELIEEIRNPNSKRKVHLHCKAGADRTGFFTMIYKGLYNIDSFENNAKEMLEMGHNQGLFPNLINSAKKMIEFFKKIKA
ncbi:MAG TPA: tyrosine-protein phosphatase [Candidatus Gastranaerophilaceae bacterium]|nr:tyrosine-protein phosphatase [Candidatus Gastranaerophilaceae bacterium]HPT41874.1 tyrosine-protein phosphatase [Candidatus Gastranaerophilaceae bacterium]